MTTPNQGAAPVLVLVDGSIESMAGLDWAIGHAAELGLPLRIITAADAGPYPASDSSGGYRGAFDDIENATRKRVRAAINRHLGHRRVVYEHVVELGPVEFVLGKHSTGAHVAVVGTRSNKGWRRFFRLSTTNRLTGSLSCPIVSVTVPERTDQPIDEAPSAALC